eukprot:m.36980 g.36980  ORF g.36980 m.36980 type:complete len:643 (-) comp10060_c0_seq1:515-2443(-)
MWQWFFIGCLGLRKMARSSPHVAGSPNIAIALSECEQAFLGSNYASCLKQLRALPKDNPHVQHNLAVALFFVEGKASSKQLVTKLQALFDKCLEKAPSPNTLATIGVNLALGFLQSRKFGVALHTLEAVWAQLHSSGPPAYEEEYISVLTFLLVDLYQQQFHIQGAKTILTTVQEYLGSTSSKDKPVSAMETLKFRLHQGWGRLHLLTRDLKACKSHFRDALNIRKQDNNTLFLRGSFEYVKGNYPKSIRMLAGCEKQLPSNGGQHMQVLFLNNMGCIHLKMQKPHAAQLYFSRALSLNESYCDRPSTLRSARTAAFCHHDHQHQIAYNLGLSFKACGNFHKAVQCFGHAVQGVGHMPHVWIRMAECAIMACKAVEDKQAKAPLYTLHGQGRSRLLHIPTPPVPTVFVSDDLNLEQAGVHLDCALGVLAQMLVTAQQFKDDEDSDGCQSFVVGGLGALQTPPLQSSLRKLLLHCHLLKAFIALQLNVPSVTLHHTREMDKYETNDTASKFLATLYTAHALSMQGEHEQAAEKLSVDAAPLIGSLSAPKQSDDGSDQSLNYELDRGVKTAQAILFLNTAHAFCKQGSYPVAQQTLSKIWPRLMQGDEQTRRAAVVLAAYIELALQNYDQAALIVRTGGFPSIH